MFVAGYNMPGYMPDSDPTWHENWTDAFSDLKETIERHYDEDCQSEESGDYHDSYAQALEELGAVESDTVFLVRYGRYVYWLTKE